MYLAKEIESREIHVYLDACNLHCELCLGLSKSQLLEALPLRPNDNSLRELVRFIAYLVLDLRFSVAINYAIIFGHTIITDPRHLRTKQTDESISVLSLSGDHRVLRGTLRSVSHPSA